MITFKKYFLSRLKSNFLSVIIILGVVLVLTIYIGITEQPSKYCDYGGTREWYPYYKTTLYVPIIFMCILAYVFPMMEFSLFKKRQRLDIVYSLPISQRVMGAVHYLTGLAELLGIFTLSYLANFILLLSRGSEWFNFLPMITHYLLSLLLGFCIYSLMVFVFNRANTVGDGILLMLAYTVVYYVVMWPISNISDKGDSLVLICLHINIHWGVIDYMTTYYQSLIDICPSNSSDIWNMTSFIMEFVYWVVAGAASAVGFFFTFGKKGVEKVGEISDSFFGFRTLIPLFSVCLMIFFGQTDSIISWFVIEALTLIAYTVYRRGFRYKKSDIAVLCLLIIFLFV